MFIYASLLLINRGVSDKYMGTNDKQHRKKHVTCYWDSCDCIFVIDDQENGHCVINSWEMYLARTENIRRNAWLMKHAVDLSPVTVVIKTNRVNKHQVFCAIMIKRGVDSLIDK